MLRIYRFGPFVVHLGRYELSRAGYPIPLARVPMEILLLLLGSGGDVLTRQAIAASVWPDTDAGEVEQSINSAINKLRSVLRDDPSRPKYIQTVIGRGYRFVAAVEMEELVDEQFPRERPPDTSVPADPASPIAAPSPTAAEAATPVSAPSRTAEPRRASARSLWRWWIAAAALVLAAAGFALLRWQQMRLAESTAKFVLTRLTNKDVDDGVTAVGLSPDGRQMVYADADGVQLQTLGTETSRLLQAPPMQEIDRLEWMDGGHVLMSGTAARPEIWLLSLHGQPPALFRQDARQGIANRQNDHVAFTNAASSEVWVAGPHGASAQKVIVGQPGDTFPILLWSLDGKMLLLQRHRRVLQPGDPANVRGPGYHPAYLAVNASTGQIAAEKDEMFFSAAVLTSNGQLLMTQIGGYPVMAGTRTLIVAVDPKTGAFRGEPTVVKELGEAGLVEMSSAARSDAIAAVRAADLLPKIYVGELRYAGPSLGPSLENTRLLTFDRSEDYTHGWLRDSSAVLFESLRNGRFQIFEQPLNRHDANALIETTEHELFARATPDGRWILFAGRKVMHSDVVDEGLFQLYRIPVGGGPAVQVPTGGTDAQFRCALTVNLCLLRDRDSFGRIAYYRLDPFTGRGAELYSTRAAASDPDWDLSPDGTTLAVLPATAVTPTIRTIRSGPGGIYGKVEDLSVNLTSTLTDLNWAADGSGWIVGGRSSASSDLFFVDRTGKATLLRHTQGDSWGTPSPDGRRLAFGNHVADNNVWLLRKQQP